MRSSGDSTLYHARANILRASLQALAFFVDNLNLLTNLRYSYSELSTVPALATLCPVHRQNSKALQGTATKSFTWTCQIDYGRSLRSAQTNQNPPRDMHPNFSNGPTPFSNFTLRTTPPGPKYFDPALFRRYICPTAMQWSWLHSVRWCMLRSGMNDYIL